MNHADDVLYQFNTEDTEGTFYIEVAEVQSSKDEFETYNPNATRGGAADEDVKKAKTTFQKALAPLKSACNSVAELMKEVAPDEATIEMGVKIGGKAGIPFMILANKDYHLKVTMTWKKEVQQTKEINQSKA